MTQTELRIPRERMVRELMAKGISDQTVLRAMHAVPRHAFVPEFLHHLAYSDSALSIGSGQTISQPYIVALMSQSLEAEKGMTVLEVGTGSGYQAAVLHAMGLCVYTVERLKELYYPTRQLFETLGMRKIKTHLSDGTLGWSEVAPFDRILVAAGGPTIPESLLAQLAEGGIMVLPVGKERKTQQLVRVRKENGKYFSKSLGPVSFVDLVGEKGW